MGWNNLEDEFIEDSNKTTEAKFFNNEFIINAIKAEFPYMDIFLIEYAVRSCRAHFKEGGSNSEFIRCLKSKLDGFE